MYHIIKKNGKDILLCSGTMKDSDFAMVKSEFGIERNQIRFVSQTEIQLYADKYYLQNKEFISALDFNRLIPTCPKCKATETFLNNNDEYECAVCSYNWR